MRYLIAETLVKSAQKKDGRNFAYYCDNCGTELYARFEAENGNLKSSQDADNAYRRAMRIEKCPICGKELRQEIGYFMPDNFIARYSGLENYYAGLNKEDGWLHQYPSTVDEKFEYMESQRKIKISSILKQKVNALLKCPDIPPIAESSLTNSIRNSTEELKTYILNLIHLENNIYSLTQHLQELYYQRLLNNKALVYERFEPSPNATDAQAKVDRLRDKYRKATKEVIDAEDKDYFPNIQMKYPKEPVAPVLAKPGLFNKKRIEAENADLLAKYHAEVNAYQIEIQCYKEKKEALIVEMREKAINRALQRKQTIGLELSQAETELKTIKNTPKKTIFLSAVVKEILDKEIKETEDLIKKTLEVRNKLYAYDIIFVKYRNVIAISSFYEYLISGRCTSLEGADGAYNIYENEIRLDHVIDQLDTVISSLEEIKKNQYMMYTELQKINSSLESLNSKMSNALKSIRNIEIKTGEMNIHLEHISKNSDVIAYNTAATAYYSKINAELTNSLGYMIALS